jgi:hypothetical protein
MVVALHHLQLLLNGLELIISIHRLHSMGKGRRLSALKIYKPIPQLRWQRLRLSSLHIDYGLHSQHLLKSRQRGGHWIDILVVLSVVVPIVTVVAVPCVGHMKYKR